MSSHVGDGNVHSLALFTNDEELAVIREAVHDMVHRAIRLGGTCTGEHGVGNGKTEYLEEELGPGTVGLMETVKRTSESVDSVWFGSVRCSSPSYVSSRHAPMNAAVLTPGFAS